MSVEDTSPFSLLSFPGTLIPLFSDIKDINVYCQNSSRFQSRRSVLFRVVRQRRIDHEQRQRKLVKQWIKQKQLWEDELSETIANQLRKGTRKYQKYQNLMTPDPRRAPRSWNTTSATLPDQLFHDDYHRKYPYLDLNGLIIDVKEEERKRKSLNQWSEDEIAIFRKRYAKYPKNFKKISSYLEKKSYLDCVSFYYLTKHVENYKQLALEYASQRETINRQKAQAQILEAAALAKEAADRGDYPRVSRSSRERRAFSNKTSLSVQVHPNKKPKTAKSSRKSQNNESNEPRERIISPKFSKAESLCPDLKEENEQISNVSGSNSGKKSSTSHKKRKNSTSLGTDTQSKKLMKHAPPDNFAVSVGINKQQVSITQSASELSVDPTSGLLHLSQGGQEPGMSFSSPPHPSASSISFNVHQTSQGAGVLSFMPPSQQYAIPQPMISHHLSHGANHSQLLGSPPSQPFNPSQSSSFPSYVFSQAPMQFYAGQLSGHPQYAFPFATYGFPNYRGATPMNYPHHQVSGAINSESAPNQAQHVDSKGSLENSDSGISSRLSDCPQSLFAGASPSSGAIPMPVQLHPFLSIHPNFFSGQTVPTQAGQGFLFPWGNVLPPSHSSSHASQQQTGSNSLSLQSSGSQGSLACDPLQIQPSSQSSQFQLTTSMIPPPNLTVTEAKSDLQARPVSDSSPKVPQTAISLESSLKATENSFQVLNEESTSRKTIIPSQSVASNFDSSGVSSENDKQLNP